MKDRLHELQAAVGLKNVPNGEQIEVETENHRELTDTLNEIQKIRMWIDEMEDRTQRMKIIHSNATFGTNPTLQAEMDSNIIICTAIGTKMCGALREFEHRLGKMDQNTVLYRIASLQMYTTKQLSLEALTNHNKFLDKYKENRMALLKQQLKLTNQYHSKTEEECESLLENNACLFVNDYESETREAQLALRDVEIRHKELIKIENAIREVRDMFNQLSFLIQQQGEKIDSVEYFANQTVTLVDKGQVEIKKGLKSRIKSNKKKIFIIAILSLILFILIVILLI